MIAKLAAWIRDAWAWVKAHAIAVSVTIIGILGAGIFWDYNRRKIRSLEAAKAIEEAHVRVASLDAKREALGERVEENAAEIQKIEEARAEVQRQVVALDRDVSNMTETEVEDAFRDLY